MKEVTDPAILAQLNGTPAKEVTDPAILAKLNAPEPSYGSKVAADLGQTAVALSPVGGYRFGQGLGKVIGRALNIGPEASLMADKAYRMDPAIEMGTQAIQPYIHPLNAIKEGKLASMAVAWLPVVGGISRVAGMALPESISAAEVAGREAAGENLGSTAGKLAGKKLTPSTITNLADPKVLAKISADMGEDQAALNMKGVESLQSTYDGLKAAKRQIFKNNGLDDEYMVDKVDDNLGKLRNTVAEYSNKAQKVGDKPAIKLSQDVGDTVNNFAALLEKNGGKLSYGDLQYFKHHFQDLADNNLKQTPGGIVGTNESRFLQDMANSLKDSQLSDPLIKKVHSQYADLSEAQDKLGTLYRLAKEGTGEVTAEKAGLRGSRDLGNLIRKQELDNIEKTVAKYDETKGLSGFSVPVKVAQEAINIQRATPASGSITSFQAIKKAAGTINPFSDKFMGEGGQKINTIANLVKKGVIPKEALDTYFKRSSITGLGDPINRMKAYSNLFDLKRRAGNVPILPTSITNLVPKRENR